MVHLFFIDNNFYLRLSFFFSTFQINSLTHRNCFLFYNLPLPGIAAATMFMPETETENELSESQLKVAFDGDAVLFSDESEVIVKKHGLDTFFEHEKEFENKPLAQVKQAKAYT